MILRNFCVFEGIDGTGTTTQLKELERRFRETHQRRVHFTNEPTSNEIGKLIRRSLKGEIHFTCDTLARLFAADRCEHLYGPGGIIDLLSAGHAVFSDRYLFSSIAYQGEAGNPELPLQLNRDFPLPEILFFFDIDPDVAMDRVEKRAENLEIYEKRDFQRLVRNRYLKTIPEMAKNEPGMQVVRIDASLPIETISEKIWSIAGNLPKI